MQIETTVPDAPVVVLGDIERLRQIVWHLLANAIKFTPRGGRISIGVDASGDQARLVVADSGPGIDPEFLPRIFERFTQEDTSPTRPGGISSTIFGRSATATLSPSTPARVLLSRSGHEVSIIRSHRNVR